MEDYQVSQQPKDKNKIGIIIAILIAAWIIGASILGAGYLISKEVANNRSPVATGEEAAFTGPVDIEISAGMPVLGANDAKVTVVEFADFQCPFCGQWQKEVFPQLKRDFIDTNKIRFVYMDFAFLGEESHKAAEAARCAQDQGKFWEYHDKLYANQQGENLGAFADDRLKKFAQESGLDSAKFNSCLDGRTHQVAIEESLNKASGYGVNSTPTIFINGYKVEGLSPYQSYKQIIEAELSK